MTDPAHVTDAPPSPEVIPRGGLGFAPESLDEEARELGIDPLALELMRRRGVTDPDVLRKMAAPKLRDLTAPDGMAGFPEALDLLRSAHARRATIGVFGDYDVDGVTTATILAGFVEALHLPVVVRVAHRERGYGLTIADVEAFAAAGVSLLLIGDTGTSDVEALAAARTMGMQTVVIDHHQVPDAMPPTDALINPHQAACRFPFKGLCSAGVAFYLCAGLGRRLEETGHGPRPDPREWLDLVALGTVCDMMPLLGENRILVRRGLEQLKRVPRPGLRALLARSGGLPQVLDEQTLGFRIGPRINAPGRLGAAEPALRLLRAPSLAQAEPLAEQVETLNGQRKELTAQILAEAEAQVAADPACEGAAALWVARAGWSPGTVGLAAASLAEAYGRPAAVLAIDEVAGVARGSVRSRGGVDVRRALADAAPWLERFGGHREAAGLSVRLDQMHAAGRAFVAACASQSAVRADPSGILVDGEVDLGVVDERWIERIRQAGPFGVGFEPPRWLGRAQVRSARVYKGRHLGLRLSQGASERDAIAFDQAAWVPRSGQTIGFVFAANIDEFRGVRRIQLVLERIWAE